MRSDQKTPAEGGVPDAGSPGGEAPGERPQADAPKPDAPIEVDVARTGGFAGITRRWTAQPPPDEASEWISLIDRCPWDDAPTPTASAPTAKPSPIVADRNPVPDGFVWWIRASWSGAFTKEAELPDDAITGATSADRWCRASGRT
jgi:hypothetical protein